MSPTAITDAIKIGIIIRILMTISFIVTVLCLITHYKYRRRFDSLKNSFIISNANPTEFVLQNINPNKSLSTDKLDILNFIASFRDGPREEIEDIFSQKCSYWFAELAREHLKFAAIVYNPETEIFAFKIGGEIYGITGKLQNDNFVLWDTYPNKLEKERIIKQCILFTE